jgi:hypothetical protein
LADSHLQDLVPRQRLQHQGLLQLLALVLTRQLQLQLLGPRQLLPLEPLLLAALGPRQLRQHLVLGPLGINQHQLQQHLDLGPQHLQVLGLHRHLVGQLLLALRHSEQLLHRALRLLGPRRLLQHLALAIQQLLVLVALGLLHRVHHPLDQVEATTATSHHANSLLRVNAETVPIVNFLMRWEVAVVVAWVRSRTILLVA